MYPKTITKEKNIIKFLSGLNEVTNYVAAAIIEFIMKMTLYVNLKNYCIYTNMKIGSCMKKRIINTLK